MKHTLMRQLSLLSATIAFSILLPLYSNAQTDWNTAGNTGAAGLWIGTNNGYPFTIKTNNTEWASFSTAGLFKLNALNGTGNGLMLVNSSGEVSRYSFTGTGTQVLTGAGSFTGIGQLAGWGVPTAGVTATANKVGIGIASPVQALEVSGNGLFTGYVVAEQFYVADIAKVGGAMTINNNTVMNGYDPVTGLRNELYTLTQPYYLQSDPYYNLNTIINHGNTGKVGIGTSSPSTKFHVSGSSRFDGTVRMDSLQLGDSLMLRSGTLGGLRSFSVGPVVGGTLGYFLPVCISKGTATNINSVKGFYSAYSNTGSVTIGHNGTGALIQSYGDDTTGTLKLNYFCGKDVAICSGVSGGNVGVGTTTPADKFQVKTGAYSVSFGSALFSGLGYGTSYMGFNATRTSAGSWKTETDGSHNGGAVMYSNVEGDVFIATLGDNGSGSTGQTGVSDSTVKNNTRLYINAQTGHIGIGTTCTPYQLTLEGKIGSREVWVKTESWCDYVFTPQHKRMPLNELEQYIDVNKHLPNIPSANEVTDKGEFSLGEASKAHLEKIEELTLYMIEMNKRLEKLEKENAELKKQVENK